jgi:hypothetical protein
MAENTINLKLFLDGKQAATSLEDFRDLVRQGNKELEGLEVGSELYNRVASAVATANTQLKTQDKLLKGLTSEEISGAYARIGGGISSTFAASTAALQMFGVESESVLKAAANAQNLLTIAISTRQIQEGLLSARMLASIVAEKARSAATALSTTAENANTVATAANVTAVEADTVATVAQTGAQGALNTVTAAGTNILRIFYATVAANPFGAILVLIGLLVTSVIALKSALQTTTTAQDEFNKKMAESTGEVQTQQVEIETLNSIVQDQTKSQRERGAALDQLKEIIPSLADVELDHANALEKINEAVEIQIPLLVKKAKVDAAAAVLQEKLTEIAKLQAEGLDKYNFSLRTLVNQAINPYMGAQSKVNQFVEDGVELNGQARNAQDLYKNALIEYNKALGVSNELEEKNSKVKAKNIKATKDQELAFKLLMKELKSINKILEDEIKIYEDLGKAVQAEDRIPTLVERTNEVLKDRSKIIEKANTSLLDQFNKLGFGINTTTKDLEDFYSVNPPSDVFGARIEEFRKSIVQMIRDGSLVQAREELMALRQAAVDDFGLDQSQVDSIMELTSNYEKFILTIQRFPDLKEVLGGDWLDDYLGNYKDLSLISGQIGYNAETLADGTVKITEASRDQVNVNKTLTDQLVLQRDFVSKLTAVYKDQANKRVEAFLAEVDISNEQKKIIKDQLATLKAAGADEAELAEEVAKRVAQARLQAVEANLKAIVEEENQIRGFFFQIQQGTLKNTEIAKETVNSLLVTSNEKTKDFLGGQIDASRKLSEQFLDDFDVLGKDTVAMREKYGKQFLEVEELLSKAGLDDFEITEETKLQILKYYLEQQLSEEEKAERAATRRRRERAREFQNYLALLNQAIGDYMKIAAMQEELALERLKLNNKRVMDSITGDNQEAIDKRLEQTKEYEAQVAAVQKRARIRQLRGDQVQAVSNIALGVTRAFVEGTLVGAIGAALIAATGAAQIATIQQQINMANSMKKGGVIKGQNGFVISGPSHENGGVMMNGGYNLEGGEMVVNRSSSRQYAGLLSQINMSNGGRPLMMSQFDDSRIVEAIAKQRSEPIRAYVVEQDISDKQAVSQRLQQLSKF